MLLLWKMNFQVNFNEECNHWKSVKRVAKKTNKWKINNYLRRKFTESQQLNK